MNRDTLPALEDILRAIEKIEQFTAGTVIGAFRSDAKTQDAVMRNLEIIGEAVKRVPEDIRVKYPEIAWRPAAAMRDFLIHEYPDVDVDAVWETVSNDIPRLKAQVQKMVGDIKTN